MLQRTNSEWSANRILAVVFGIIFALLGIIGFFTPAENSLGIQAILGIFDSNLILNVIFLITGLLGIAAAFRGQSHYFNRVFGVVYFIWGILSFIPALYFPAGTSNGTDEGKFLGFAHLNPGDGILFLVAGIIALVVAFFVTNRRRTAI